MTVNKTDKKILYELVKDARITNSAIAKKVKLSKDSIGYRIKQLEKKGFIQTYRAIIDVNKIGYQIFRVYLRLIDTTQEELEEIISFLKENNQTWWIAKLEGNWDFLFAYHAKSNKDFYDFYFKFNQQFRKHVKEKMIAPIPFYSELPKRYLTDEQETITISPSDKKIIIDEKDKQLLKLLSKNGKITILKLSEETNLDIKTIKSRIKKLEEQKIILGYTTEINSNKLNRDFYTIGIDLNNFDTYNAIKQQLLNLPEVTSWVLSIGGYDIECDIEIENTQRFYEITNQLKNNYPEIREIRYFRITENYKIQYMPEE
ncbi:MAG: winged helix-turn-helix transcriptional regulator [bacterium]